MKRRPRAARAPTHGRALPSGLRHMPVRCVPDSWRMYQLHAAQQGTFCLVWNTRIHRKRRHILDLDLDLPGPDAKNVQTRAKGPLINN